jgi:ABC-type uncharacterized transport system substrate-binding protein
MTRFAALAVSLLAALSTATPAGAHPHSWIDVRSAVLFADDGRVTGIEQQWTFDELYTSYVVEEMGGGRKPSPKVVAQFASKVIANLEPFRYFVDVTVDGKPVKPARVTQYASEMRGQRLWLRFVLPLATPIDPRRQATAFSVYDPTYYIAMEHADLRAVSLTGAPPTACQPALERTTPAPSVLARAFSMDAGAPADDTLGRQFAQKVVLTCR